jgi:hypothetical protein
LGDAFSIIPHKNISLSPKRRNSKIPRELPKGILENTYVFLGVKTP